MAFDNDTRNKLAAFVHDCRRRLCGEYDRPGGEIARLLAHYGIQVTGEVAEVEQLPHLDESGRDTARLLRELLDFKRANSPQTRIWRNYDPAVYDLLQEQAFTVINRLCALRMAEARGILIPCVSEKTQSQGFQLYEYQSGKSDDPGSRYRHFLYSVFDEIAVDLPALFDRFSPQGLLFPSHSCIEDLLDAINAEPLQPLWTEDETIGWIYQYWNSQEERRAMRDASAAPRNSRELAVRNQFFTPRYVVEFLTDNTLGRIWYEMTKGETKLKEQCRYLVRRPNEIFLAEGEVAPTENSEPETEQLSQEELLRQTVYIPHRPLKDPREIRLLDPACGSMHFGLYAFDLFERIYEEAWDLAKSGTVPKGADASFSDFCRLTSDFSTREAFLRAVPALIIEHNIHGVDIDPRAVQIAGLSLWLRAQKAWQAAKVAAKDRPAIKRSNVVCAEPMPGNKAQLESFCESLKQPAIRGLVEHIFDKMQLAGEAGTLLKIEEEITDLVATAKKDWLKAPKLQQAELFQDDDIAGPTAQDQSELGLDFSGITDEAFWGKAEERIYAALRDYAESAEASDYQRRLFAEDAAHGFAFIDLCRKRYDAVVMNPPFGTPSSSSSLYLAGQYPTWNRNILCGFVERTFEMLNQNGKIGAIFDRTILVKKTYTDFRLSILTVDDRISVLSDLGWEVLDANVEVSSFILTKSQHIRGSFYDIRTDNPDQKPDKLKSQIAVPISFVGSSVFSKLPNSIIGYDFPQFLLSAFEKSNGLSDSKCQAYTGHQLPKDRHFRLWWENRHPHPSVSKHAFKGGSFFLYVASMREWLNAESKLENLTCDSGTNLRNKDKHFVPGVCYGERGDFLNVYLLPSDMYFTLEGPAIPCYDKKKAYSLLAFLNSPAVLFLINKLCGQHKTAGYVNLIPFGDFSLPEAPSDEIKRAVTGLIKCREADETQLQFSPFYCRGNLNDLIAEEAIKVEDSMQVAQNVYYSVDKLVREFFNLNDSESQLLDSVAENIPEFEYPIEDYDRQERGRSFYTNAILSISIGATFGRWDIRYATGERQPPELPDPFDPLPVCPPGMLHGEDGLPPSKDEGRRMEDESAYPLHITWDGILVDDEKHPDDIVARVREALRVIWGERASAIEQEAVEILRGEGRTPKDLRDYFRTPGQFFASHLARYSKSRRKAPIYWPLSTESGDYTLWLYYHRLDDQTLIRCVNRIEKKAEQIEAERNALANRDNRSSQDDSKLKTLNTQLSELSAFRASLEKIAKFWKPNLNDGVQITAAPLWEHFRHTPWRNALRNTWQQLKRGDYDWAHLAHSIWPERVIPKCAQDRSLAIAHGHEARLWHEVEVEKGKGKKNKKVLEWQPVPNAEEVVAEILEELKQKS